MIAVDRRRRHADARHERADRHRPLRATAGATSARRLRAAQRRPQPGHLGAARDVGRPEARRLAGPARLPRTRATRGCSACTASGSTGPRTSAPAWDEALAAGPPGAARGHHRPGGPAAAAAHPLRAGQGPGQGDAGRRAGGARRSSARRSRASSRSSSTDEAASRGRRAADLRNVRRGRAQRSLARGDGGERAAARRSRSTSTTTAARSATSGCGRRSSLSPVLGAAGVAGGALRAGGPDGRCPRWAPATGRRRGGRLHAPAGDRAQAGGFGEPTYNLVMGPPAARARLAGAGRRAGPRRRRSCAGSADGALVPATPATCPSRATDGPPRAARGAAAPARGHDAADARALPGLRRAWRGGALGRGHAASCSRRAAREIPPVTVFTPAEEACLRPFLDVVLAQDAEPRIPVFEMVDAKFARGKLDGYRYEGHARGPRDLAARGGDARPTRHVSAGRRASPRRRRGQDAVVAAFSQGDLEDGDLNGRRGLEGRMRGVAQRVLLAPVGVQRDRLRRPRLPAGLRGCLGARTARAVGVPEAFEQDPVRRRRAGARVMAGSRAWPRGPSSREENDSAFLLDPHRRAVPGRARMPRYATTTRWTCVIVGCGRRRLGPRAAPGARAAGASSCSSPGRSGTPTGLGLRRGRLAQALLDRATA